MSVTTTVVRVLCPIIMSVCKNYADGVPKLEEWLKTQPYLPQSIDHNVLKQFLKVCDGDQLKTQKLIKLNYTIRLTYPNIFLDRDPSSEATKKQLLAETTIGLPGFTPQGNKVFIYKLEDDNPELFNFTESIKIFIMMIDARTKEPNVLDTENASGEIPIFDMTGYTLKHLASSSISTIRIFLKFLQEALTVQLKEIHIINCPSFVDKVMSVVRPFMRSEIFKMIKFHQPNSETLYDFIPKEMMPLEYGGQAGEIKILKKQLIELMENQREYLMDEKYWKINEELKPSRNEPTIEMEGKFRSLNVD